MVEVEIRAFVSDRQFERLLQYLTLHGEQLNHTRQITHYLDHAVDTRIQVSSEGGKVWQKLGKMHDSSRQELEVEMSSSDAAMMLDMFCNLGFARKVSWYRERKTYQVGGITASLDDTVGYGRIFEGEIRCQELEAESSYQKLESFFKELDVVPATREEFDHAFARYLSSWREITGHLDDSWITLGQ